MATEIVFSIRGHDFSLRVMAPTMPNPAFDAFVARIAPEMIFAEVLLRRSGAGFDVRHVSDRESASLRPVSVNELRDIVQFTEHKQFRPLKSAPSLQRGWCCTARGGSELEFALHCLYPGAVADWFAGQQTTPPVTGYRDFAARQTGMYRIAGLLTNEHVTRVARSGCDKRFCLKQRLWTAEGLPAEDAAEKSLIPCLEPCAVLLEFARTVARLEQQERRELALAPVEAATLVAALERAVPAWRTETREADFAAPQNARNAQLLLDKLKPLSVLKGEHEDA